jgi:hypothetical protein
VKVFEWMKYCLKKLADLTTGRCCYCGCWNAAESVEDCHESR